MRLSTMAVDRLFSLCLNWSTDWWLITTDIHRCLFILMLTWNPCNVIIQCLFSKNFTAKWNYLCQIYRDLKRCLALSQGSLIPTLPMVSWLRLGRTNSLAQNQKAKQPPPNYNNKLKHLPEKYLQPYKYSSIYKKEK